MPICQSIFAILSPARIAAASRGVGRWSWPAACAGWLVAGPGRRRSSRKPTPAQKEAELRKLNQRIEKVRKAVNAGRREARQALRAAARRRAGRAVGEARSSTRSARSASSRRRGLHELEIEKAPAGAGTRQRTRALGGELRAAYFNGREEQLKLLLNQEDPATLRAHAGVLRILRPGTGRAHPGHPRQARAPRARCARRSRRRRRACRTWSRGSEQQVGALKRRRTAARRR